MNSAFRDVESADDAASAPDRPGWFVEVQYREALDVMLFQSASL